MSQTEARNEAIKKAKERLAETLGSDGGRMAERCARLGLPAPSRGSLEFSAFGLPARLDLSALSLTGPEGTELPQTDQILFFHYLECDCGVSAGGNPISFRDFPGGAFYWEPFRARTGLPLVRRFGADILAGAPTLRAALGRFEWSELALGDFGARIHGFGCLYLVLVAHAPEEGLGAEFNLLFEPAARRVYCAEDAAAFASRICLALR
jgi:hypothetical protein